MNTKISRRDFLKLTGAAGGAFMLVGCSQGSAGGGKRSFIDRLRGIPLTQLPQIEDSWTYEGGALTLDMTRLPELDTMGGAVRIEGDLLTEPILVFQGDDGVYYALKNVCTHAGRMIDPIAGTMTLECCSASSSTYDYQGNVLSGPAEGPLTIYPVTLENDQLIIQIG